MTRIYPDPANRFCCADPGGLTPAMRALIARRGEA